MRAGRKPDIRTLLLLLTMWGVWLGNFALYRSDPMPLALHVLVSAVAIHLAFTIWHEAVHRNVFRSVAANDLVGVLGMLPYMTPYFMQKWIHLQHHARLNEPDDPNLMYANGPLWSLPLRYPRALGYAKKLLEKDPREGWQRACDVATVVAVLAVFGLAAWFGAFWSVFWLWAVPLAIAKLVMDWYINYLPHVGLPPHRWKGTRVLDVDWLTPLVLVHNYHAIHHLWPTIPWHAYRKVFREKRAELEGHDVPIETRVVGRRWPAGGGTELVA